MLNKTDDKPGRVLAAAALLALSSLLFAGCEESDPAEAMLRAQSSRPAPPPAAGGGQSAPAADLGGGAQLGQGSPADGLGDAADAAPADGPEAEAGEPDLVVLELIEVKAPYPEFDQAGNYTVELTVESIELTDYSVWEFVAYDKDDIEVGKILQGLKIPYKNKKSLKFDSMYYTGKPVRFEVLLTDKVAVKADSGSAAPAGGAGGGSAPPGGGGGPGATPPSMGDDDDE